MGDLNNVGLSPSSADGQAVASLQPENSGSDFHHRNSTSEVVKREGSESKSPLLDAVHIKTSRSPSISSPIKLESDAPDLKPKLEEQNGSVSPTKPAMPKKSGRAAASKAPPRTAPLFTDLPDVTAEATSSFQVITSSTYQNKYLGITESALECDCSEEWSKSYLSR
jgi:[histone H3]-lysine36 N-trimethyltransferase